MKSLKRLFLQIVVAGALLAIPISLAEANGCWECTYIVFVGYDCNMITVSGTGKTVCNSTNGCHLSGAGCSVGDGDNLGGPFNQLP